MQREVDENTATIDDLEQDRGPQEAEEELGGQMEELRSVHQRRRDIQDKILGYIDETDRQSSQASFVRSKPNTHLDARVERLLDDIKQKESDINRLQLEVDEID